MLDLQSMYVYEHVYRDCIDNVCKIRDVLKPRVLILFILKQKCLEKKVNLAANDS